MPACLLRDILGNLRATFLVREMLEGFCFRGWKLPQGLYNRSNFNFWGRIAQVLGHFWDPYPQNTRNSDHGLSFPSPETQTMVWVSRCPNKFRVWGGLSFGPSFSRTMVWVSSREGRNTGVGVDEWALNFLGHVREAPINPLVTQKGLNLKLRP